MTTTSTDLTPAIGADLIPLSELAKDMPALLEKAEEAVIKMQAAVRDLPAITDEESKLVAQSLNTRMKQRLDEFNAERMPFTRKLNEIIKRFTGNENIRKSLIEDVDKKLNKWATEELAKSRAAQAKIDADLNAQKAKIELDGKIKEHLRQKIDALLDNVRAGAGKLVSEITAETMADVKKKLSGEPKWLKGMEDAYNVIPPWLSTADHDRFKEIAAADLEANKADYLARTKQIMIDSVSILDVALTNKAEAQKLMDANAEAQAKESEQKTAQAAAQIDAEKAIATLDVERPDAPKVRLKMKINVTSKAGWVQIFSHWLEQNQDPLEDYPKRTLLQMKTLMEKIVNGPSGFAITHPDVEYVEDVKAK